MSELNKQQKLLISGLFTVCVGAGVVGFNYDVSHRIPGYGDHIEQLKEKCAKAKNEKDCLKKDSKNMTYYGLLYTFKSLNASFASVTTYKTIGLLHYGLFPCAERKAPLRAHLDCTTA